MLLTGLGSVRVVKNYCMTSGLKMLSDACLLGVCRQWTILRAPLHPALIKSWIHPCRNVKMLPKNM